MEKAIENQEDAVKSGDKKRIVESVEKGAKITRAGSGTTKSKEKVYKLAHKDAPASLEDFAKAIEDGKKTGADENVLMGHIAEILEAALED